MGPSRSGAAIALWDVDSWAVLSTRHLEFARASGALAPLSAALNAHRVMAILCGDFEAATSLGVEEDAVKEVTGTRKSLATAPCCWPPTRGGQRRRRRSSPRSPATRSLAGRDSACHHANWATAILHNGLGPLRRRVARGGAGGRRDVRAVRRGVRAARADRGRRREAADADVAADALRRLSDDDASSGSDWAAGIEARSRALLSEGEQAERCYAEAVERLGRTPLRPDLARAHLLYGEWLRREGRRVDARHQLRAALRPVRRDGRRGVRRARAPRAAGHGREGPQTGRSTPPTDLTPQEEHIARLARDGRTNPEIAAELFLSARTVEWHLRKVFTKLGITSRKGLDDALPARGRNTTHEW